MSLLLVLIWCNYFNHFALSQWIFSGTGGSTGQIEFTINIKQTTTDIDITYHGTDKWIGIGFGSKTMTNAYAMIFAKESNRPTAVWVGMDYWLNGHGAGQQQQTCNGQTCVNLISRTIQNTDTIIKASIVNNNGLFTFDPNADSIDMIMVDGQTSAAYTGGHCNQCWSALTFVNSPTSIAAVKIMSKTQLGTSPIYLQLIVYQSNNTMDITLYGPNDRWFGIAFGTHSHADGLIVDDIGIHDYYLGGQDESLVVKDSIQNYNIISNSVINSERVIHVTRLFDTSDSTQDLIFDMNNDINTFMVAHGASTGVYSVSYHSNLYRWPVIVGYDGITVSSTTSTSTTLSPTTPSPTSISDIKIISKTRLGTSPIYLQLIVYQSNNTMDITLYGPNDRWFGIAFGTHSHADGLIVDDIGIHDYYLGGQDESLVVKDSIQNYNIISNSVINSERVIHVTRLFDTSDSTQDLIFDMNNDINTFMVAHGASTGVYSVSYHSNLYRWPVIIGYDGITVSSTTSTSTTLSPTTPSPTSISDIKIISKTRLGTSPIY
eukprot:148361_1